ncbi:hypothetical protein [Chryseobacterium gambrini]|uniref:Uncharacterized protein n=1 Tax=Chryseobacterium gambrini TaxID=373672 RepID=A0ABN7CDK1_9FLAO|nr:hypothetical protein CRDW_18450 [Chryseobacterium gambrini]
MAYSQIEQETLDLDIFFKDSNKYVHIATGGGQIPNTLASLDISSEEFKELNLESLYGENEIDINPTLSDILNIENLESYLVDFIKYAKLGFYSYDKTNIGDFKNQNFHLVAKPKNGKKLLELYNEIEKLNVKFPENFQPFNLQEIISEK